MPSYTQPIGVYFYTMLESTLQTVRRIHGDEGYKPEEVKDFGLQVRLIYSIFSAYVSKDKVKELDTKMSNIKETNIEAWMDLLKELCRDGEFKNEIIIRPMVKEFELMKGD